MARVLLVWQSRGGRTATLADAVLQGIRRTEVEVRSLPATQACADDLLWADGCLLGCGEHFGSMSGLFKDFLERIYDPLQERIAGRPYALFVAAGNDGRGAAASIERILRGLQLKQVQEPLIWRASDAAFDLQQARELGQAFAAGVQMGLW